MTVISHVIGYLQEQFPNVVLDQQGTAKYAHDLKDRSAEFEVVLDNGNEAVGDDGHMYLYPDSILGLAPKGLDAEMLLNPLEEEFHLSSVAVKQGDVLGRKVEVVSIVDERPAEVWCVIDDTSEVGGIISFVPLAGETDGLVEQDVVLPIDIPVPVDNLKFRMPFLPDNEECAECMDDKKSRKVEVSAVEYIAGVGFICNPVHCLGVMYLGCGDAVEHRYLCDDVNLGVDADAGLCAAEVCPSEDRHAEVDCCGVHCVEPPVELKLLGDSPLLGKRHHVESELLENPRVAEHVCLSKGIPDNWCRSKSEIIRPFGMSGGDVGEFSETSATHNLTEHKHEQVIPVGKAPAQGSIVIFLQYSPESSARQKEYDLRENVASIMHMMSKFGSDSNIRISNV